MNTVEANVIGSAKIADHPQSIARQSQVVKQINTSMNASLDVYTGVAANDAIMAKAFSNVFKTTSENLFRAKSDQLGQNAKSEHKISIENFDSKDIQRNIVQYVHSSILNFAREGHDQNSLNALKEQASEGVKLGFNQALVELDIQDKDSVVEKLSHYSRAISAEIENLEIKSIDLNKYKESTIESVSLKIDATHQAQLSFDQREVFNEITENKPVTSFTTSESNLSFSITGTEDLAQTTDLADLVNQADVLINQFYNDDLEKVLSRLLDKGESVDVLSRDQLIQNPKVMRSVSAYKDVSNFNLGEGSQTLKDRKILMQYQQGFNTFQTQSERVLASKEESNQIVNSILNQMKELHTPDLLSAINRFHSFNQKL